MIAKTKLWIWNGYDAGGPREVDAIPTPRTATYFVPDADRYGGGDSFEVGVNAFLTRRECLEKQHGDALRSLGYAKRRLDEVARLLSEETVS